jgi:hypothetical protein
LRAEKQNVHGNPRGENSPVTCWTNNVKKSWLLNELTAKSGPKCVAERINCKRQREALHCSFIDRIRTLLNQQDVQKDLDDAREQIKRMRFDLEAWLLRTG